MHMHWHVAKRVEGHLQRGALIKIRDKAAARLCRAAGQDQLFSDVLQVRIHRRSGSSTFHVPQPCHVISFLLLYALLPLVLLAQDFGFGHGLEPSRVRGRRDMRSTQAHIKHAAQFFWLAETAHDFATSGQKYGFALTRHLRGDHIAEAFVAVEVAGRSATARQSFAGNKILQAHAACEEFAIFAPLFLGIPLFGGSNAVQRHAQLNKLRYSSL